MNNILFRGRYIFPYIFRNADLMLVSTQKLTYCCYNSKLIMATNIENLLIKMAACTRAAAQSSSHRGVLLVILSIFALN